jgi:putative peptide maturation dehydrogenase
MQRFYRRPRRLFIECADRRFLDPAALFGGRVEFSAQPVARVHLPPRPEPVVVSAAAARVLAASAAATWQRGDALLGTDAGAADGATLLQQLVDLGLLEVADAPGPPAASDDPFRDWWPPALLYHHSSRWQGVLAEERMPTDAAAAQDAYARSQAAFASQVHSHGPAPAATHARGDDAGRIELARPRPNEFDALLARRETHRLFDTARPLARAEVERLLYRVFATRGSAPMGGGLVAKRKTSPSGGGLHPVEAYPLVVDVDGLPSGWYHYRAEQHALAPIAALSTAAAREKIVALTAGQRFFASAAMLVLLTLRFPRHQWKYPNHAKAYRVMLLEMGHLGQTFYLSATEAGLGAFFTAAINDADVDAELGFDGIEEGAVAAVGCGHPAADGQALRLSGYLDEAAG